MACYRNGGCGPYEGRACNECPASKPEYVRRASEYEARRRLRADAEVLEEECRGAYDERANKTNPPIKIKVFLNEDGVSCVLKDTDLPIEIEFVDEVAIANSARDCGEADVMEDDVDAYINQLCGDGFTYIGGTDITVTNSLAP